MIVGGEERSRTKTLQGGSEELYICDYLLPVAQAERSWAVQYTGVKSHVYRPSKQY